MENTLFAPTIAGHGNGQTRAALAPYQEWHFEARDEMDAGSTYTAQAAYELRCACCVLTFDLLDGEAF